MTFVYLNLNPLEKHTGDCVVRALSFALNQSWDETYWQLCRKGFDRAEMPSWNSAWWDLLKDKGYKRYLIEDSCPACYTVADFCREHPEGRYVLFIPHSSENAGHVTVAEDSIVYDTWDCTQEIPLVYWRKE